ncbi:30S ribosomal protein S5 [[Mycoplasma] mobile]|uniref:Small ribosomal subunit protein uS5 n=1 Tax=Mycoplasma mobile (strain ATCC 43663 / 163K / NCTC 11711) TaxID=267748 RepID=RS5_MYCM1|nr:RecName: Full=Small ribosomal subunit protein uS5; AltName: Full=30S ribosomal protein S5 [Mycoplasma mobile 163K]AAT27738.1 30S ribosomal protein s5 [Mycoplasma mobile 163K]
MPIDKKQEKNFTNKIQEEGQKSLDTSLTQEIEILEEKLNKNPDHKGTINTTPNDNSTSKNSKDKDFKFKKKTNSQNFKKNANKKPEKEFEEKIVNIARVTNVVKGGRRFSFAAVVVVGDKKGRVGYGHGKALEVPDAIKKAVKDAQNNLIRVPIINKSTVPHEQWAKFLASKVMLKPAPKGKGIIASNSVRAVVELAGYTDIYTKSYGSRSKENVVKAVFDALKKLRYAEDIAKMRDLDIKDL